MMYLIIGLVIILIGIIIAIPILDLVRYKKAYLFYRNHKPLMLLHERYKICTEELSKLIDEENRRKDQIAELIAEMPYQTPEKMVVSEMQLSNYRKDLEDFREHKLIPAKTEEIRLKHQYDRHLRFFCSREDFEILKNYF